MGFWDSFTDLIEAATPWSTVEAEAVQRGGAGSEKTPADKDEGGEGEAEVRIDVFFRQQCMVPWA
jgi:ubiquinol-cytochrome c reductase subunit 6